MTTRSRYTAAITGKPWWLAGGIPPDACVAAYQAVGASSYVASKMNLTGNATYNATDGAAYPTWDSAGWAFNGVNQYLRTNYIPQAGANLSVFVRANQFNPKNIPETIIGMHAASSPYNGVLLRLASKDGIYDRYSNDGNPTDISYTENVLGDHVIGVAGREGFLDGTSRATWSDNAQAFPAYDLYMGALHYSSTIQYFYGNIYAVSIYKAVLTPYQVQALTNAMNAL